MQRVSSLLPSWDRSRSSRTSSVVTTRSSGSKPTPRALDKVFGWAMTPINRTTTAAPASPTRYGRETYWPSTLDNECEKAARILKSFCSDGFLAQEPNESSASDPNAAPPLSPKYITQKIPPRIIQNAVGIAIFSCMRSGLWMSGSGGSGILIARKADGTWSPPSGILLHTADLGFSLGIDIYDCVLVINNVAVLESFTRPRVTLGVDVALRVGPLVASGLLENELQIRWKELDGLVLTYLKARGKHQNVELDGSLVTERTNENERFYAGDVNVLDILADNIPKQVSETRSLFEVIKAAEGRSDYDTALMEELARQPAPGDATIEMPTESPLPTPKSPFGFQNQDDPDPFGIIALEMAGLEIREAGAQPRPASSQFDYNSMPTSPLYPKNGHHSFQRQSIDTYLSKSNRGSYLSTKTQATTMTDMGTQTDFSPAASVSKTGSDNDAPTLAPRVKEIKEVDYMKIDSDSIKQFSRPPSEEPPSPTVETIPEEDTLALEREVEIEAVPVADNDGADEGADDADDEDEEEDEDPIVFEVATAAQPTRTAIMATQVTPVIQAKGALVTIPKRVPPPLPTRSPARVSRASKEYGDVSALRSPLRTSFSPEDLAANLSKVETASEDGQSQSKSDADVHELRRNSSSADSAASVPSQPNEAASSAEDSDREPQTPQAEEPLRSSGIEQLKNADTHAHGSDNNIITVA